jgi:hypothetical protein
VERSQDDRQGAAKQLHDLLVSQVSESGSAKRTFPAVRR